MYSHKFAQLAALLSLYTASLILYPIARAGFQCASLTIVYAVERYMKANLRKPKKKKKEKFGYELRNKWGQDNHITDH